MWILIVFNFLCQAVITIHLNRSRKLTFLSHLPQALLQTFYACDGRLFILNQSTNMFDLFKDQPADIRMPTTPIHNSGLNMVALGYNSAFFIANIYVSNININKDYTFHQKRLQLSKEQFLCAPLTIWKYFLKTIQDVVFPGNWFCWRK